MTDASVIGDSGAFTHGFLVANQLIAYGRFAQADQALADVAALAGDEEQVAMVAAVRASNRFWRLTDPAGAHRILDDALHRVDGGGARDAVRVQRALLLLFEGRTVRAVALSRGVRRRGRAMTAGLVLGAAVEALGRGLAADTGVLVSLPVPDPTVTDGLVAVQHGVLGIARGLARSLNGLDPTVTPGPPPPSPARAAMAAACLGTRDVVDGGNLLYAGRPRSALDVLRRAVDHLRASDRLYTEPIAHGQIAYCQARLGDAESARQAADEAERHRHPVNRFETFFVGRGQAWAAGVRGELTAAAERLVVTAEACERFGQPVLAAQAWADAALFGEEERAAGALHRLAAGTPDHDPATGAPTLTALLAGHVGALAEGDAAGVGRAAVQAHRHGHVLRAAEAAAQAAVLHGRPHRGDADRWADLARTWADACEGARSPAFAPLSRLELTRREREVVALAAQGLTSPDIAGRLHLSVRTVENHLQAGYHKLGVHRREDLAHLHPFGWAAGSSRSGG
jgi:DNA-binding CsgD family transcriptional regulator